MAREAAARYPVRDRYARHFAFGKLTGDPVFRYLLDNALIPAGAQLLDLGCGQGLLAALLAAQGPHGVYRYRGIDSSSRDIERARAAARPEDEMVLGDIRAVDFAAADVVVMLDVLQYLDPPAQLDVLGRARSALASGGTLLLRVADASRGLRFRVTEAIDLAVTRLRGHSVGRLHSVTLAQRVHELESQGFCVDARPMSAGTPFANVLLVARYDSPTP